ncbi:MAG: ATP-binding protein [Magnetospiraceae bacterium]
MTNIRDLLAVLAGALLIAVIWLLIWGVLQTRSADIRNASLILHHQARTAGEIMGGALARAESDLDRITHIPLLEVVLSDFVPPLASDKSLIPTKDILGRRYFRFIDVEGRVLNPDGFQPSSATTVAEAAFFRQHKFSYKDFVLQSTPVLGEDRVRYISLSRSVYGSQDQFLGVVQHLIPVAAYQQILAEHELGGFDQAVLFDEEKIVLTAWPPVPETVPTTRETRLSAAKNLAPFAALAAPRNNQTKINAAGDVVTTYKLQNYPLYIGLMRSQHSILVGWKEQFNATMFAISVLVIATVVVIIFLRRWQLRERENLALIRRLHRAVEQSPTSIIITDLEGTIEYVNPAFSRATGYAETEVIGQNPRLLKSGFTSQDIYAELWNTVTHGGEWQGEFLNQRKDGSLYWESAAISPIRDEFNQITNFLAVKENITEQKRITEDLRKAKFEAEKANKAKSEFLAAMSHDLRTPLNAILGFSDMIRCEAFGPIENPHYEDYINDIHKSGALLLNLINDVLDLSKIEADRYNLVEEEVNIPELIRESAQQVSLIARNRNIDIVIEVMSAMPLMTGDQRAMIQILNNLLSNAAKFTRPGGKIFVGSHLLDDGCIRITVRDTGIGMTPEGVEKALRPFEQADGQHSRQHEGTGLGLHLCANLMKLFDGTMDIQSAPDVGTTVVLTFPARRTILTEMASAVS